MKIGYFNPEHIPYLFGSLLLAILSFVSFVQNKDKLIYYSIWGAGILLGLFMAQLDNFLLLWDEQYHALVAKNMLTNPFKPMLYLNPVIDFDYRNWTSNHVWVHKQPLFLWLMAISIKLFGATSLAVRIPSIIMHAIVPLFIFRIGELILNKRVGYIAALLFLFNRFFLELMVGRYPTDHNDFAFLFFVSGSFWAWTEYTVSHEKKWIFLIGLFCGAAILVKWLVGLLIIFCWGCYILLTTYKNFKINNIVPMFQSLGIAIVVALPWQLYIMNRFHKEIVHENEFIRRHFFEALDGHTGNWTYHLNSLYEIYGNGELVPVILLISLLLFYKKTTFIYKTVFVGSVLLIYLFFSIASTKMIAFCTIVSPVLFISIGLLIDNVMTLINRKIPITLPYQTSISFIIISLICILQFEIKHIERSHTMKYPNDNHGRLIKLREMEMIDLLNKKLLGNNNVIFNTPPFSNIPIMFFTNCIAAYDRLPTVEEYRKLKKENLRIVVIENERLSTYLKTDSTVTNIRLPNPYKEYCVR